MRDLLVVLNPRRIEECLSAIRELPIDKLWLRNMSELDIEDRWDEVMEASEGYDRLIMQSDDGIPRRQALAVIQWAMNHARVATGYSNFSREDMRVNLTGDVLTEDQPQMELTYDVLDFHTVQSSHFDLIRTRLVGFSLTGMSREMWLRFPFKAFGRPYHSTGFGSDYSLSKRLQDADVAAFAARDAFVYHVKETWNQLDQEPRKRLLVGIKPPSIELECV